MFSDNEIKSIYTSHGRELYVYIYRFLGCHDSAEDILHDAFINLIEYSKTHSVDAGRVRAFLYKTSHNLCVNHLKKTKREIYSDTESRNALAGGHGICEDLIADELQKKIYEILEMVDEKSRSVFIMKKELGMSTPEVARNLGISERSVTRKLGNVLSVLADGLKSAGFVSFLVFLWLILLAGLSY